MARNQNAEAKCLAEHCTPYPWANEIMAARCYTAANGRTEQVFVRIPCGVVLPSAAYRYYQGPLAGFEESRVDISPDVIGRSAVPFSAREEIDHKREKQVASWLTAEFAGSKWSKVLSVKANSCGAGTKILHVGFKDKHFDPDVADYLRSLMPFYGCTYSLFIESNEP